MGVGARRQTDRASGRDLAARHHERAALVARRARDPRRHAGPRGALLVAGRPADDVSCGPEQRPSPHGGANGRWRAADLDRHRTAVGHHPSRSTRHRRKSSRRLGVRRRGSVERHGLDDGAGPIAWRAGEARHPAEALHRLRELGRRGIHAHLVNRMGRAARGRARRPCRGLSERRQLGLGSQLRRLGGAVVESSGR